MPSSAENYQHVISHSAAALVTAIRAHGANQGHIARILGVSVASVSRWESGERTPSQGMAWRLEDLHRDLVAWGDPCAGKCVENRFNRTPLLPENPFMAAAS